jgi:hypothetical protein
MVLCKLIILYNEIGKRADQDEFARNHDVVAIWRGFTVPRRDVPEF